MMSNAGPPVADATPSENANREDIRARTHAAALNVELRSPLARIELATSQLAREALTPAAHAYAEQIFEAVVQIDELVERSLRVLVPRGSRTGRESGLAGAMAELRRRFEPALEACGVAWVAEVEGGGQADVIGDPDSFRARVCELLRLVLEICAGGGRIETAVRAGRSGGPVFRLAIVRNEVGEASAFESVRAQFEALRARMLEAGVRVTGEVGSRSSHIELVWSPSQEWGDASIPASTSS